MANEDLQRSLLMAQISKKRALKEKYLRQPPELPPDSPPVILENIQKQLRQEAELFQDLIQLLEQLPDPAMLTGLLEKETDKLKKLHQQENDLYRDLPQELKDTKPGKKIRESVLLLGGAVAELSRMTADMPGNPGDTLSDIVYLLENAGTPV